jgi:hypothetical protein
MRLVLKEGWPDHFLIRIQMLIPAGVVDCLFKLGIYSFEGFSNLIFYKVFHTNKRKKKPMNQPPRSGIKIR